MLSLLSPVRVCGRISIKHAVTGLSSASQRSLVVMTAGVRRNYSRHRPSRCPSSIDHGRRTVTTWTPLASTFNSKAASQRLGVKFTRGTTGLFGIEALKESIGFYLMKEDAIAWTERLVAESISSMAGTGRRRKMVEIFDELSDTLCKVADLAEFVRVAHPDEKYARAAEDACLSINALVERLNTNTALHAALRRVVDEGDTIPTDDIDKHVAKLFLFDFEQSGIHLDDQKRNRAVHLNEGILQLGSLFMQSTFAPRLIPRDKLQSSKVAPYFSIQENKFVVTGLCGDSPNDEIRETAYTMYMAPDPDQERRLRDLLSARSELAQLCGFPSFGHRVLRGSLAESPEVVDRFLNALSKELQPRAKLDFDAMLELKLKSKDSGSGTQALPASSRAKKDLKMWDLPYLNALMKHERFNIGSSEMSPYFSLGGCMEGLNYLFECLYDVSLQLQQTGFDEIWAPDVHKLAVVHKTEGTLGFIYCDFLERTGKPNQDCHFTIRGGRELADGTYQLPVVVLVLNFPSPTWTTPSLLTPSMLDNLFHEMGHAMHSMLARTKYQHVTGTRCSTDFAEVPSILMEYFANDPKVLSKFALNYRTGEKMPEQMLAELCASRNAMCASDAQLQVFYSALDQRYHSDPDIRRKLDDGCTTGDILADVQAQYFILPHEPNTAWQHRFGHLVGYGAKYYAYLMSKAVASWIWQQEFQNDPFNREAGERYRRQILAHGGGRPPKQLLEDFLGQKVTPEALVQSLTAEIDAKRESYNNLR